MDTCIADAKKDIVTKVCMLMADSNISAATGEKSTLYELLHTTFDIGYKMCHKKLQIDRNGEKAIVKPTNFEDIFQKNIISRRKVPEEMTNRGEELNKVLG